MMKEMDEILRLRDQIRALEVKGRKDSEGCNSFIQLYYTGAKYAYEQILQLIDMRLEELAMLELEEWPEEEVENGTDVQN